MTETASSQSRREGISPELDELTSTLVGIALDQLADTGYLPVLLVLQDEAGDCESFEFDDDGIEQLLEAARDTVGQSTQNPRPAVRYALAYEGAIEEGGAFRDALLLEFGERGWEAYSAYSLIANKGAGDAFAWTEMAPGGIIDALL